MSIIANSRKTPLTDQYQDNLRREYSTSLLAMLVLASCRCRLINPEIYCLENSSSSSVVSRCRHLHGTPDFRRFPILRGRNGDPF